MDANELGELGMLLVREQLVRLGLFSVEMPKRFDFDLYTNNDLRIEVKSARRRTDTVRKQGKYEYEQSSWTFNNSFQDASTLRAGGAAARGKRLCDFYVLVCFDQDCKVERFYVVPNGIINHQSKFISIPDNKTSRPSKSRYTSFLNSWSLLLPTPHYTVAEEGRNGG